MRNISRAIAALICLSLIFAALVSCHGRLVRPDDEETTAPIKEEFKIDAEFDESKPIEITFWGKNEIGRAHV